MKKSSVSLSAVLAIIFAVSNSIATEKNPSPFTDYYAIWGISSSITVYPSYAQIISATKTLLVDSHGGPFNFDESGGISITDFYGQLDYAYCTQGPFDPEYFSDFNVNNSTKDVVCSVNTNLTCIAYTVDYVFGTDAVLAVKTGAYSVISE